MSYLNVHQLLRSCLLPHRGKSKTRGIAYFRPRLQVLEHRLAPAQVNWINSHSGNWGVAANWDVNRVPGPSDDAVISQAGITVTHSFGVDSVRSLTSQAAIIDSGGSLALGNALSQVFNSLTVTGTGILLLNDATLGGSGALLNGSLVLAQGTSSINAAFTNAAGATLRVRAATLTVANGFINNGLIELTGQFTNTTLAVGNGTLTNGPSAIVQAAGLGSRLFVNAQLDNQGEIRVFQSAAMTVGNNGHTFTNTNGTLNVDARSVLTINGGITVMGDGTVFAGAGVVDLAGTNFLTLASDLTLPEIGATLTFSGTVTIQGSGVLTNQRTLELNGVTVNVTMANQGVLVAQGTININGAFANAAGAVLRVMSNFQRATLTVANGFTNNGIIELSEATFTIGNGTLTNARNAIIQTLPNTGGFLNAQLDNQGKIRVFQNATMTIGNNGHTFTNTNGTLNVDARSALTVNGGITVMGNGTVFAGAGVVDLAGTNFLTLASDLTLPEIGAALTFSGTVTIQGSGVLTNQRTLELNGVTVNVTLANQGVLVAQGTSNINGTFANAAGATLRVLGRNFQAATLTVANGFTNNGIIELGNPGEFANATLTVSNGTLTNAEDASIQTLTGIGGNRFLNAQLDNQGTLLIMQAITLDKSAAAHRNSGTISVLAGDLTVNQSSASFTNTGTIAVGSGTTFTLNGASLTNFSGGTLTGGTYFIDGTLRFPNAAISTNAAAITLEGASAQIVDQAGNDALSNFRNNTAAGSFAIQYGRNFTATSAFSNAGTLLIGEGSTFTASLTNFSGTTLTGGVYLLVKGTLKLTNGGDVRSNAAAIVLDGPASALLNQSGGDALANFATNTAAGSFALQNGRNFSTVGGFTNAGILTIDSGSTFTATGTYTQSAGTTNLAGGILAAGGLVDLQGGILNGNGTINASVRNAGRIDVGSAGAAGLLAISGNYTQTTVGVLNIEIGGTNPGTDFDQITISGQATLDGTLNVSLINGFVPASGDAFRILRFASLSGVFRNTNIDPSFGPPTYNPTDVTLMAI